MGNNKEPLLLKELHIQRSNLINLAFDLILGECNLPYAVGDLLKTFHFFPEGSSLQNFLKMKPGDKKMNIQELKKD